MSTLSFLDTLSKELLRRYGEDGLEDIQLLFPNRRSPFFFLKALSVGRKKPIFAPGADSLEDFLFTRTGYERVGSLELLLTLYEEYRKLAKEKGLPELSFNTFSCWGEAILSGFDEIDAYLQSPDKLFVDIRAIQDIELQFNFLPEAHRALAAHFWRHALSDKRERNKAFIQLWNHLPQLYTRLNKALDSQKKAYSGQLLAYIARQPEKYPQLVKKRLIFVGFNALSKAAYNFMCHCLEKHGAEVHWDLDEAYVGALHHEAGHFFRRYRKDRRLVSTFPESLPNQLELSKDVYTHEMQSPIAQVKGAVATLKDYRDKNSDTPLERIVIVLPQEDMLLPLLHALPRYELNISMGYRLAFTPVRDLILSFIPLFDSKKVPTGVPREEFDALCTHTYLAAFCASGTHVPADADVPPCVDAEDVVLARYPPFLKAALFEKTSLLEALQCLVAGILEVNKKHADIDPQAKNTPTQKHPPLNRLEQMYVETLRDMLTTVDKVGLGEHLDSTDDPLTTRSKQRIFRTLLFQQRIAFTGEPLRGLQIMGPLETRNLDFDCVIMLDMNEGSCPPRAHNDTLLPQSLRRAYDLPTVREQDAAYAYIFYRLLHCSKEMHFFYLSSQAGDASGAEKKQKSRFLYQMKYDNLHHKPRPVQHKSCLQLAQGQQVRITKTDALMERWRASAKQQYQADYALSVSALNDYLRCPMDFYYKRLQRLSLPISTEDQARMDFGTSFHKMMEDLYTDLVGQTLTEKILVDAAERAPKLLQKNLSKQYNLPPQEILRGKYKVFYTVLLKYVKRVIDLDKQRIKRLKGLRIKALEKKLSLTLPIPTASGEKTVCLYGKCDRIDETQETCYVLDYKTGKSTAGLTFDVLFNADPEGTYKDWRQLVLYAWMSQHRLSKPTEIMLLTLPVLTEACVAHRVLYGPEELLTDCLSELLNSDVPFRPADEAPCEYCPYGSLCYR